MDLRVSNQSDKLQMVCFISFDKKSLLSPSWQQCFDMNLYTVLYFRTITYLIYALTKHARTKKINRKKSHLICGPTKYVILDSALLHTFNPWTDPQAFSDPLDPIGQYWHSIPASSLIWRVKHIWRAGVLAEESLMRLDLIIAGQTTAEWVRIFEQIHLSNKRFHLYWKV